jgi:ribokinase
MAASSTIHVIGSMMIDRVVRVRAIPRAGETVAALSAQTFAGGKGANQAAAAAKFGARVRMLGRTGRDGAFIRDALREAGVRVRDIATSDATSGAATVMVAESGENAIVIAPESNLRITKEGIETFLASAKQGEIVLFQNECALLHEGIAMAAARALRVWLNAAPANAGLSGLRFEKLAGLIVNETEAEALTGEVDPRRALEALAKRMPGGTVIVTLGADGAIAALGSARYAHRGFVVDAVDTVGCGDAFVGVFLAAIAEGRDIAQAMSRGNAAGALAAMRAGALRSLPSRSEVEIAAVLPEKTKLKPRPPAEHDGAIPTNCLGCGYALVGRGEGEACPECGRLIRRIAFTGRWVHAAVRRRFEPARWWSMAAAALWIVGCAGLFVTIVGRQSGLPRPLIDWSGGLGMAFVMAYFIVASGAQFGIARGLPTVRSNRIGVALACARLLPVIAFVLIAARLLPLPWSVENGIIFWGVIGFFVVDAWFLAMLERSWRVAKFPDRRPTAAIVGLLALVVAGVIWSTIEFNRGPFPETRMTALVVALAIAWIVQVRLCREIAREIRARE